MRERVVRFGTTTQLAGVLTEPAGKVDGTERPAFIILNSGIMHRVGTCRLSVRIARSVADRGFTALRFDHAGIGDSEPRRDSLPFEESAPQEAREAMDYLSRRKGAQRFVMLGLCSGADMSFETALLDPRVVGVVQIDAYAYWTKKARVFHFIRHYAPKMRDIGAWGRFVQRRILGFFRIGGSADHLDEGLEVPSYIRGLPPRGHVTEGVRTLAARAVEMYYIYTGGDEAYQYSGQFFDMHPGIAPRKRVKEERIAEADHILTDLNHQRHVAKEITDWACHTWPSPHAGSVSLSRSREALAAKRDEAAAVS